MNRNKGNYRYDENEEGMTREKWRDIRNEILERDEYRCFRCGKRSLSGKGLSIHHIISREDGGKAESRNLITLCKKCHDFVELNEIKILSEIKTSYQNQENYEQVETEVPEIKEDENAWKNEWHSWVYGGNKDSKLRLHDE